MDDRWLEVTLPVPADRLERVCDILTVNGMAGLVVEEEGDFLRFLEQNRQYWDYVDEGLAQRMKGASRVKFYVPDSEQGQRQLRQYLAGLRAPDRLPPGGGLGHLLAEVLSAHPGGAAGVHRPRLDAGAGGAGGPDAAVPKPRPHLRHRGPPHHPAVPGAAGGGAPSQRPGAGFRLRIGDSGHCGAGTGGLPGGGRGY